LLLDDELPGLTYLKLLCEQIPELEVIKAFNHPDMLLKELPKLDFDLCILDIEMPGIDGIQVAGLLKGRPVIFTTAYKNYATDAFDLDAVDYIVKPVTLERLQQAINKVNRHTILPERKNFVRLNTDKGQALLVFDQLVYVRTSDIDPRDKTALMENGTILQLKNISFEKLAAQLPVEDFCRINKKELISVKKVLYFSGDHITINSFTSSGKPLMLTLGEAFRNDFMRKIK
jgi:DNA-binding LytR/AlgR family response regulator